ncbi:MAG: mechanosensitive ion channel family protein [Erysipelotrichaceae bacterium]|nr:mechanosensitive ion channel family protein [Erysipelotrichaceae bacterium]
MEIISSEWSRILDALITIGFELAIIIAIFVIAKLVVNAISKITGATMKKAEKLDDKTKTQKIKTSMTVTHSANRYLIYLIAIILSLKVLGLGDQVSSAMVAAGIGGLVISLGAQSIVKDMIAGLFLLFERQFYVGDYVKIGDYEGVVKSIALRVTYLDCAGKKVIIPNGSIEDVVNYSRCNNLAVIEIPISYENDIRKVIDIIQKVVDKYYEDNQDILTENKPVINGIDSLDYNVATVSVRIETKPLKFWDVQKQLQLLIAEELKKKKIVLPYKQLVIKDY